MSDSDLCVGCSLPVEWGQDAVSCDECEYLTHLWCNTGKKMFLLHNYCTY